jgi:hypothetical protein
VLVQIPIASTAIKQSAGNLDSFISFLCPLNIIDVLLLQASTTTHSKLFRYWTNSLLDRKPPMSAALRESSGETKDIRKIPAGMLQSVI